MVSAKGLAKADVFGKSDPFAVVLLNRREIGRTRTLFKTLDPCWSEPRETFSVRLAGNRARCSLVVQLWDEDLGGWFTTTPKVIFVAVNEHETFRSISH